jgi:hypothetical protein
MGRAKAGVSTTPVADGSRSSTMGDIASAMAGSCMAALLWPCLRGATGHVSAGREVASGALITRSATSNAPAPRVSVSYSCNPTVPVRQLQAVLHVAPRVLKPVGCPVIRSFFGGKSNSRSARQLQSIARVICCIENCSTVLRRSKGALACKTSLGKSGEGAVRLHEIDAKTSHAHALHDPLAWVETRGYSDFRK